jgi:hypothetical protein
MIEIKDAIDPEPASISTVDPGVSGNRIVGQALRS